MNPHDELRLAEHRPAFLRHLPRQVEKIGRRLHRFLQLHPDVTLTVLLDDAAVSQQLDALPMPGLEPPALDLDLSPAPAPAGD